MSKKASIQFNWVFILVAGAIFIIFFTTIALKYKSIQEEKTNLEILNNLDTAITSLQSSPFKTTTSINLPLATRFTCTNNRQAIKIGNTQYPTSNIVSAPEKLKGEVILSSTQLSLPFKIATLYYILPASQQYIFVYNDQTREKLENIRQDLSLLENIAYEQEPVEEQPEATYIYLTSPGKNKIRLSDTSITFPGKEPLPYYNNQHLYSLLFSHQPECISSIIQQELAAKTKLYINKISMLQSQDCNYALISSKISQLPQNPQLQNQEAIIQLNKQLINQDCPAVF